MIFVLHWKDRGRVALCRPSGEALFWRPLMRAQWNGTPSNFFYLVKKSSWAKRFCYVLEEGDAERFLIINL